VRAAASGDGDGTDGPERWPVHHAWRGAPADAWTHTFFKDASTSDYVFGDLTDV
jgi:hypothetical protein